MRYRLPTDRLINMLVPHFLSGRRYILFLQSLVYPLQKINERFCVFARQKVIDAHMTSQVMYFEWYLNRMFGKYLKDPDQQIYISEGTVLGVDIYQQAAKYGRPFTVWSQGEVVATVNPLEEPRAFYFPLEEKAVNKVSFMVCVPELNTDQQEFVNMISYAVDTYKLAGKTYLIRIDGEEIYPQKTIRA